MQRRASPKTVLLVAQTSSIGVATQDDVDAHSKGSGSIYTHALRCMHVYALRAKAMPMRLSRGFKLKAL